MSSVKQVQCGVFIRAGGRARAAVFEMKGDTVEIVVDAGDTTRRYEVTASKAGRRVEVTLGRGIVEVTEVTRSGTPVRTARFMASRVLALVEHPSPGPQAATDGTGPADRSGHDNPGTASNRGKEQR